MLQVFVAHVFNAAVPARHLKMLLFVTVVALAFPTGAVVQAGAATDLIVGRVSDAAGGTPVDHAVVTATSRVTGLSRSTQTGADGRYVIVFAEGGGRYVLTIRRIGYAVTAIALERRAEADRINAEVALRAVAAMLDTIVVSASSSDLAGGQGAGTSRTLAQERMDRLPLDAAGDLAAIAALAPGVVGIAGTDTSAAAFSVGGQRPTQNHVSLDGLTSAVGAVPRDAIRETRVVTSTYDVARGQFSGGEVASSTRSGTNTPQGSLTYDLQAPSLQAGAAPSPAFSREYRLNRLSGSVGGPIRRNRIFAFLTVEGSDRNNPIANLLVSDPLTDSRLGIDPDTARRFLALATAAGLPLYPAGIPQSQTQDVGSSLGRLDFVLSQSNHLVVRADWRGTTSKGTRGNPRGLLHQLGRATRGGAGIFAGLTTQAGRATNDVRVTGQTSHQSESGYAVLPPGPGLHLLIDARRIGLSLRELRRGQSGLSVFRHVAAA